MCPAEQRRSAHAPSSWTNTAAPHENEPRQSKQLVHAKNASVVLNSAIASAATPANLVAPNPDAPRQVLPQMWRHAAGFGIGHLESKLHPASAAGRRNRALVPIRAR
jgi:hypothetical protein